MNPLRRTMLVGAASTVFSRAFAQPAPYPDKPIRLITPFSPGGATDVLSRIISEMMATVYGHSVVVENKPGASGLLGTTLAARAAPDGYTLVNVISTHAIQKYLHKKMPYDSIADFAPIALYAKQTLAFAVHPSVPVNNVRELVEWAKANDTPLSYGTSGIGTAVHLSMEMFAQAAGIQLQHVPFAGGGPAVQAALGGHVQGVILGLSTIVSQVKAGQLKGIFVTSAERAADLPDVPTLKESGYPDLVSSEWWALLAPAGTPRPIISKLNAEIEKIFSMPAVKERLVKLGIEYQPGSPDMVAGFIRAEAARGERVLKAANIKPE